jgi:hypothetical protein
MIQVAKKGGAGLSGFAPPLRAVRQGKEAKPPDGNMTIIYATKGNEVLL